MLASRCISCRRKSSFLPISPPASSSLPNCSTWLRKARQLFAGVAALGEHGGFLRDARRIDGSFAEQIAQCALRAFRHRRDGSARKLQNFSECASILAMAAHYISAASAAPSMRCISSSRAAACCNMHRRLRAQYAPIVLR